MSSAIADLKQAILAAGPAESVVDPTVYRRIMTAANHEEPDRVPIWDFIDSWPIYQRFAPGETDPTVATAKVFNGLGVDMCRSAYMPVEPGTPPHHGQWEVAGASRWWIDKPVKTLDDLRAYQVPEYTEEQAWQWVQGYVNARNVFAPETLYVPCDGVGFHGAYGMMGLQFFSYALYDAPADCQRIIEGLNEHALLRAKAFAEVKPGPLFLYGDDIAFKGRAMFAPEVMKRLFYPYLKRLRDVLNPAGIKVVFHTDGYIMDIADDLLDTGIAGLNPIEPLAGNDLGLLKRRYGKRCLWVGGVDCSQLLPRGTVQDVREGVKRCLLDAGEGGGYFIGSSSEIVPATPVENILAFYDACHEYGRYPLGQW